MPSYRNSDPRPPIMQGHPPPPEWRVPRAGWDLPPWNRWSFQNIRKVVPTEAIRRGDSVTPWDSAPRELTGIDFEGWQGRKMTVADMLDDYTDGFLVAKDGKIVHESYHNGMARETLHLAMSVTKSVVSTAAGVLIGQGRLDPAAPVTDYLPELVATGWQGATLQQVLDMTSGVRFVEEYTDLNSDIGRTDIACGWRPRPPDADPALWPATMWDQVLSLKERDADHGARFSYRSIETDVLGFAIARVTGMTLGEAISALIWAPMGAEEDALITVDANGTGLADGGMCASLRDFARFGQTLLDGGVAGGRQVIPKAWVADVRGGDHGLFDDENREWLPNGRYRNMFWIPDAAKPAHLCLGVFGQLIAIMPEERMVVAKLSSWPDFVSDEHSFNVRQAIAAIAAALS